MMLFGILAVLCTSVAGPDITAGDLAKAVPVFTPADPTVRVGYAPTPGIQRIMQAGEIHQLLTRLGVPAANLQLSTACFERPLTPLSVAVVTAAMRKTLGPEPRLEIADMSGFRVPAGELVFPIEDLGQPPVALWRGYILYDGDKKFHVWAHVKIHTTVMRLVALEDLKQGTPIKLYQVALRPVDGFPDKRLTPLTLEHLAGSLPRRYIPANSPVWSDAIDPPMDVTKGDRVTVTVNSGLATISIDAEAETSGRRGDPIALKNIESGKMFRARIDAPGEAVLEARR
jgi:flagella basal body P-ring formation protein FlgA